MKCPLMYRKSLAAAWMVLCLGVSGAFVVAHRPAEASVSTRRDKAAPRVFKSKNRGQLGRVSALGHAESVRMLAIHSGSKEGDQALIHAVAQWADETPSEAITWLGKFPRGELRDWLSCAAATAMAGHDPVAAASFLQTEMPDEGLPRNHAIVAIIQRWAQHSPESARQWLDRLGPTSAKDDALREIAVMESAVTCPPVRP